MPYTLNGIGTMYYGKQNREEYESVCENCGKTGWMSAYETRLWFTILFIPIIPLKRQQVIDYCPSCSSHKAIPLEEWYRLKEQYPGLNSAEKEEADTTAQPHEPDKSGDSTGAIDRHLSLLHAGNEEEAESMAREMDLTFAGSLDIQLYLASYYLRREKEKEAQAALERVLQLDPENRWARRHVGIACLRKGSLTRARQLLSYLLESHTPGDAGVILELSTALWESQRYSEAYAYFEVIARDFKRTASKNGKYRRMVKDTEARTGSPRSILPPSAVVKRLAVAGIVLIVLLGILYAAQTAAKQRTLYVVNGLPVNAVFTVPGKEPLVIGPSGRFSIVLKEGEHQASVKIEKQAEKTVKFTLSDGFWARLFKPSTFVFNIEGAAVIIWQKVRYRENPREDDPYHYNIHTGEPLIKIEKGKIDYLFTPLPETITIVSGDFMDKTRLGVLDGKPGNLVWQIIHEMIPPNNVLTYLESHLQINPGDETLPAVYVAVGKYYNASNRCAGFFENELSRRPVLVDWHRYYQELKEEKGESEQLVARYDSFLEQEPGNSALLYLRGRLAENMENAFIYYDKAIAADAENPFPYFAKAYHLDCRGEFSSAWEMAGMAYARHPESHSMKEKYYQLAFAAGKLENLEFELKSRIDRNSTDWDSYPKLVTILAAQNKTEKARRTLEQYQIALRGEYKDVSLTKQSEREAQLTLDYLLKDFDAMKKHAAGLEEENSHGMYLSVVYLNRGDMEKLDALPEIAESTDGYGALLYWLGWMEKGDPDKAAPWLKQAKEYFQGSSVREEREVGRWLVKPGPGITAQLDEVMILPESKRTLYAAFSRLYPPRGKALLARAEKMNYMPTFPYHFLKRLTNN